MIRRTEERDMEAKLDLWYEASLIAHHFLSEEFLAQERINIRDVYSQRADTWVYEADGQVVGFISMADNEVGGIFVHPDWQGKGVGQALMNKAFELHDGRLKLEVFADNPNARRFYERYGFVTTGEYLHEETGFMMVKMSLNDG